MPVLIYNKQQFTNRLQELIEGDIIDETKDNLNKIMRLINKHNVPNLDYILNGLEEGEDALRQLEVLKRNDIG